MYNEGYIFVYNFFSTFDNTKLIIQSQTLDVLVSKSYLENIGQFF